MREHNMWKSKHILFGTISIVLLILIAMALCAGTVPPRALTKVYISVIERRVIRYVQQNGRLPERLADLRKLKRAENEDDGDYRDAWGQDIIYESTPEGLVTLRSLGPDRKPGGGDDVVVQFNVFGPR